MSFRAVATAQSSGSVGGMTSERESLKEARACFSCRLGLPWPCRCNHTHDFQAPPNSVQGRAGVVYTCTKCGLQEWVGADGGD